MQILLKYQAFHRNVGDELMSATLRNFEELGFRSIVVNYLPAPATATSATTVTTATTATTAPTARTQKPNHAREPNDQTLGFLMSNAILFY